MTTFCYVGWATIICRLGNYNLYIGRPRTQSWATSDNFFYHAFFFILIRQCRLHVPSIERPAQSMATIPSPTLFMIWCLIDTSVYTIPYHPISSFTNAYLTHPPLDCIVYIYNLYVVAFFSKNCTASFCLVPSLYCSCPTHTFPSFLEFPIHNKLVQV